MKCRFCNNFFDMNQDSESTVCINCKCITTCDKGDIVECFYSSSDFIQKFLNSEDVHNLYVTSSERLYIYFSYEKEIFIDMDSFDEEGSCEEFNVTSLTPINDVPEHLRNITPKTAQELMKKYKKIMLLA